MVEQNINGKKYRLPNVLNPFQLDMYVHLIDYKKSMGITEPGIYHYLGRTIKYDAILPEAVQPLLPFIYDDIRDFLKTHHDKFPFKYHPHFNHVVSSQAANINLFLPMFYYNKTNEVLSNLRHIRPDFGRIATNCLHNGFRIEFWDGAADSAEKGILGDHCKQSGTDSDIAIAYYNKQEELCLWLIEHKLTEAEFTACGGYKSNGRKAHHDCSKPFHEILKQKSTCYYHDVRKFNYWNITEKNQSFFPNHSQFEQCPFQGGINQLWRNQLLALALEQKQDPYKHVYFSVVRHPRNTFLEDSIEQYKKLINGNPKFSVFTSQDVVDAAAAVDDPALNRWVAWYKNVYMI